MPDLKVLIGGKNYQVSCNPGEEGAVNESASLLDQEAELIQNLYLSGRKSEAEAAIPQSYLDSTSLIGSEGFVKERLQVYKEAGVTNLNVSFQGTTSEERVRNCDAFKNLIEKI